MLKSDMENVTTERLLIRRMAITDLQDFLAYQTHPESLRYLPGEPFTEEKAADFLARQTSLEVGDEGGWIAFAVELRSEKRMIGEIGIYLPPSPRNQGDLGWSIHPDYQGHGYATEAATILLAYAFREHSLHRVTAGCDARNVSSFRLMERLGMRREAHFRQSKFTKGVWHDEYQYALLRSEWLQQ